MKKNTIFTLILVACVTLISCNISAIKNKLMNDSVGAKNSKADTNNSHSNDDASATNASEMFDSAKLQSDLNDMVSSMASGKPDTTKMKNAAADIMQTDAAILSDSGIDKLYGNSNDPAVKTAAETLKKMRNGMGITKDKLDSIKQTAEKLKTGQ